MKKSRGWLAVILALSLVLTGVVIPQSAAAAKKKVKLSKKTATVKVGKKVKIKVKNTNKKVKWSIKSGKKYIKLKNVKKKTVTVEGKKAGNAKIQVKVGKQKLLCKIKVKNKTGSGNNTNTRKDDKVTGTPGKNITLPEGTTVFNVGGRKLALGISYSDVKTILGNMSNDIIREEKSPQGFDVISYNPAGTYSNYILIYLKNNVVKGICAVGKNVQYGEGNGTIVSTGTSSDTLKNGSGWSAEKLFDAKEGTASVGTGAYKYTASAPAATVLAYVDYFKTGGNQVYCIQVYSSDYSRSEMLDPNYCTYDDSSVLTAMKLETVDLLNAYCAFYGYRTLTNIDGLAKAAQDYCNASITRSDDPPAEQKMDDLKLAVLEQNGNDAPLHFAQITMSMSSDSIGFANSILEQEKSSEYIIKLSYTAQRANSTYYKYYYKYLGVGVAVHQSGSKKYTYMIVDLVDLWKAGESW